MSLARIIGIAMLTAVGGIILTALYLADGWTAIGVFVGLIAFVSMLVIGIVLVVEG